MSNKLKHDYVKSKVNYSNVNEGDLCKVIAKHDIYIEVVKVGMTQIHYLYNFEAEEVKISRDELWRNTIKSVVLFLAGTNSNSAGRAFNDVLLHIDGGDLPSPESMKRMGDLAPPTLINEVLKVMGDVDVEFRDDMIDDMLLGNLARYIDNLFIHAFYTMNLKTIKDMVDNWAHYGSIVKTAHNIK
ncbi:hypothetical protein VPDG_00016 [Vibrio phage henriette 12B8]|uniref:hypothetical protein n=1 Tax=Vibrio phage henriette 12B8 TaxID=573174 RepID=UPI0002C090B6|nr:hypothetical protein VPDG_00016 [Vibrio phage henriette 12B8]AGG58178.1 hypothetical protein VPDG_00016 [Vibrio phage henriette 12B8]